MLCAFIHKFALLFRMIEIGFPLVQKKKSMGKLGTVSKSAWFCIIFSLFRDYQVINDERNKNTRRYY